MSEYVTKESIIKALMVAQTDAKDDKFINYDDVAAIVHNLKVQDVQARVKAKWLYIRDTDWYYCNNCGEEAPVDKNSLKDREAKIWYYASDFCPGCGADMR